MLHNFLDSFITKARQKLPFLSKHKAFVFCAYIKDKKVKLFKWNYDRICAERRLLKQCVRGKDKGKEEGGRFDGYSFNPSWRSQYGQAM